MPNTIADELTLIIPLGLLLVTLGWWGWLLLRHGRRDRD
jgi:hypothetical protein